MFARRRKETHEPEPRLLTPRTGSWLQRAYVQGILRKRRHAVLRDRRGCGRSCTIVFAVTSVVARSLADALQGLFQNPPRRRGSAGRPAVNAAGWVGAATLGGRRPMLKAAWTRVPRASEVQNHSPRIPRGKVTKWQSISISPCQEAIIG